MKLLLALCEGDHDVSFITRSARSFGGFAPFDKPLQDYPIPLGKGGASGPAVAQFLVKSVQRARPGEESIKEATKPPLPLPVAALHEAQTDTLLLLFESGGQLVENVPRVSRFLDDLFDVLSLPSTQISACATAFFVDADDLPASDAAQKIAGKFGPAWSAGALSPAVWVKGARGPLGAFVFSEPGGASGSLEDLVAPLVAQERGAYWSAAERFIDDNAKVDARVKKARRHRLKAVITAAGQFDYPGSPMDKMIRYDALPSPVFQTSAEAKRVAAFLRAAPW